MTKTISVPVNPATLAETARLEPVIMRAPQPGHARGDRGTEYDETRDRVMVAVRAMQRTAASRGLMEAELEKLLADES